MKEIRNGMRWGDWQLHADSERSSYTLLLESGLHHYEVRIDEITDTAKMLDWIFQLRMKTWVTNDIMGDLLSAFLDLFAPQTTLCGAEIGREIDARSQLRKVIAP